MAICWKFCNLWMAIYKLGLLDDPWQTLIKTIVISWQIIIVPWYRQTNFAMVWTINLPWCKQNFCRDRIQKKYIYMKNCHGRIQKNTYEKIKAKLNCHGPWQKKPTLQIIFSYQANAS